MFLQPSHFCVWSSWTGLGPYISVISHQTPNISSSSNASCPNLFRIWLNISYIILYIYILAEYILHHPISHHDYHPMNSHIQWLIQDFLAHGGLELARKINYQQYICISSIKTLILFCLKIWYPRIPNFPH